MEMIAKQKCDNILNKIKMPLSVFEEIVDLKVICDSTTCKKT